MVENRGFIKRLNPQADVIDIMPLLARRLPTFTTDRPVHIDQVNQGRPGTQVDHAEVVTALLTSQPSTEV